MSKSETLQRAVFTFDHNMNTNIIISLIKRSAKTRICFAWGKWTRNFGVEPDFDKMSLERKFRFPITAYLARYLGTVLSN